MDKSKNPITHFGVTDSRNKRIPFGIKAEDRTRHMYVIGKTGMGKSTLLENMVVQDIQNGNGVCFIDPHGKTADLLLEYVPEERIKDVIYFAPFDLEHPISFNVMEDVGYEKRHLVANGLMSAFKKIWVDAWSARMEYILNNILLALLEYPDSTLIGVNRMLTDKEYRKKVVDNISDPSVKAFWTDEFAKYGDRYMQEAGAAIQNKIGQFISNPLVRNIIGQPKSTFDLRKIMDEKKILIINLSKGRVGESNANLLGSMLITKIYLAAMSRADASEGMMRMLPNFYLFVDEFQSFANESFADILSEARKYKLNLTIAHQYIEQMTDEVRAAVFGNVGTMIIFRVGAFDAEVIEKEFFPTFTKEDIVSLDSYQIYLKLMIDGVASAPFSARSLPPIEKPLISFKEDIIRSSREMYTKSREYVEDTIRKWHEPQQASVSDKKSGEGSRDNRDNRGKNNDGHQGTSSGSNNSNQGSQNRTNNRPDNQGSWDELKKFPKPPRKETRESELRKAISMNYALNAQSDAQEKDRRDQQQADQRQEQSPKNIQQDQPSKNPQSTHYKKDNKGPTTENLSALRNALANVINTSPSEIEMPQTQSTPRQLSQTAPQQQYQAQPSQTFEQPRSQYQPQPTQPQFQPRQMQPIPAAPEAQNEVPEEVLRRIFDIDR